jgi:hypothetical protein
MPGTIRVQHINTLTYHLIEKYGYPIGTKAIGIDVKYVERANLENKDLKISYGNDRGSTYILKRSQTQNLPIWRGFGARPDVYLIPINILGKSKKQLKYEEASREYYKNPEEYYKKHFL